MCGTLRFAIVPKNTTAYATQTSVIRMSIGHSSSAYSCEVVIPSGSVIAARRYHAKRAHEQLAQALAVCAAAAGLTLAARTPGMFAAVAGLVGRNDPDMGYTLSKDIGYTFGLVFG